MIASVKGGVDEDDLELLLELDKLASELPETALLGLFLDITFV